MARNVVERIFPDGPLVPITEGGSNACLRVVDKNESLGVTWVHSSVSDDKNFSFCVQDASDADAIRAADCNGLPVKRITKGSVLDPISITEDAFQVR